MRFADLDREWVRSFWLPLLDRYEQALFGRVYQKYPRTLATMIEEVKALKAELEDRARPRPDVDRSAR